jgi:hypothetical protein
MKPWSSQALIRSLLTRSAARIGRHRLGPTRQRKGTRRADRKKGQTPDDDMSRMLAVIGSVVAAHRSDRAGLGQALGAANGSISSSAVGGMSQLGQVLMCMFAGPDAHLQRIECEIGAQLVGTCSPAMRREKTSMTNAAYVHPAKVRT